MKDVPSAVAKEGVGEGKEAGASGAVREPSEVSHGSSPGRCTSRADAGLARARVSVLLFGCTYRLCHKLLWPLTNR